MCIKEKTNSRKERKEERRKRFREEHPKLADALLTLQVAFVVIGSLGGMYFLGYSDGAKLSPRAMQKNFEKSEEETEEEYQKWVEKQREIYRNNFDTDAYNENAAQFESFARNITLQPGEAYFLWDDSQFRGEGRPVDAMVDHQVYGIKDPKFQELDYNPWEFD